MPPKRCASSSARSKCRSGTPVPKSWWPEIGRSTAAPTARLSRRSEGVPHITRPASISGSIAARRTVRGSRRESSGTAVTRSRGPALEPIHRRHNIGMASQVSSPFMRADSHFGDPVEQAIEIFAAVQFFVIGLSHILKPRVWVEFFTALRNKGHAGVFVNGFLSLIFGSMIVAFHNVWTGLPMVLTILGWAQVTKGLISFVMPQWGMRGLQRVSYDRTHEFVVGGFVFLALSALMLYIVLTQ